MRKEYWVQSAEGKGNFLEAKKSFMDIGASTSKMRTQLVPKKNDLEVGTTTKNLDSTILKLLSNGPSF